MAQKFLSIAVDLWQERDRVQIYVTHGYWDNEIACWRDDEVSDLFRDGVLKGSFIRGPLGTHTADHALLESIYGVLSLRGKAPEFFECGNCGCNGFYVSTFCNFAHCASCGWSVDEDHAECYINPAALHNEIHCGAGGSEFRALNVPEDAPDQCDSCPDCGKNLYYPD